MHCISTLLRALWMACENEMGGACSTHKREEKCIQNFRQKT
jgi:hypothetical protein